MYELADTLNDIRYELMREADKRFYPNLSMARAHALLDAARYLDLAIDELLLIEDTK
jgi:hypothetical protein